jgi:hypothetical protein
MTDLVRGQSQGWSALRHPLARLVAEIDWDFLAQEHAKSFRRVAVRKVGPGTPISVCRERRVSSQSYLRVAKRATMMVGRHTRAHQFKRQAATQNSCRGSSAASSASSAARLRMAQRSKTASVHDSISSRVCAIKGRVTCFIQGQQFNSERQIGKVLPLNEGISLMPVGGQLFRAIAMTTGMEMGRDLVMRGNRDKQSADGSDAYPPFDYRALSSSVSKFLRGQADRIRRTMGASIINLGKDLIAAKRYLSHGAFLRWVEGEVGIPAFRHERRRPICRWLNGPRTRALVR